MTIKQQIIARFNRGAETYDQAADLQAKIAQNLSYKLPQVVAKNILEIGCGTGLFSQYLVKTFPEANILLTDISPLMIEQCRRQLKNTEKTNLVCLDGEKLAMPSTFDLITSSMTLHWFKELESSLIQIKQKLKKGGRFLFSILTENSLQEWKKMCAKLNLPVATPHFPSIQQLEKQLPGLILKKENIKVNYPNVRTFLNILKSLGATATRENYVPLTSAEIRQLMRNFQHEITITYEVIYGEYHLA